jgi:hypothetical protein
MTFGAPKHPMSSCVYSKSQRPCTALIPPRSRPVAYNPQVKAKLKDGALHRRVRGTCGGNISDYDGIRSSFTADMQTVKLLLNAVVSEDANFCTADIKDFFYLGNGDLEGDNEYMWLIRRNRLCHVLLIHLPSRVRYLLNKLISAPV